MVITVSAGLRDAVVELGTRPERVVVLRNGVDLGAFRPAGRATARAALEALARRLSVAGRVGFAGQVPHAQLPHVQPPTYYTAADLLVLASEREGWANVLLESMACGTPVVASPIPGDPEVVQERAAGLNMAERSAAAIAACVRDLAAARPNRPATRAYAERFSWAATSQGQLDVSRAILGHRRVPGVL